jgi:hypothetical protein
MLFPPLEVVGVFQPHPDGRGDSPAMDKRKPAERYDAEQQLRGLTRGRVVQT